MKLSTLSIILFYFFLSIEVLLARPVSYKDSWTIITNNDYKRNSLLLHYSPSSKYSVGYKAAYWKDKEYWLNTINLNYLFKRINKQKSQTNFYLNSGLGILKSNYRQYNNRKELVSYGGLSLDWETRKLFSSYKINALKSSNVDGTFMQNARFGFAPYLADFGKLHTWFMYQLDHTPENSKIYTSNFIIRLFKSTNLIELGLSEYKDVTLNYIKRF